MKFLRIFLVIFLRVAVVFSAIGLIGFAVWGVLYLLLY
jgi:hypothetical protein